MFKKINLKKLRAWNWYYIAYRVSRDSEEKEELYEKWKKDFMHRTYENNTCPWLDADSLKKSQIIRLKNAYHNWEEGYAYDAMTKMMNDNGLYPIIKLIGKMPLWLYKAGAFLIQGLTHNSDVRNEMRKKALMAMTPFMEKLKSFLNNLPKRKILNYTEDSIGLVETDCDCQNRVFRYHDWKMPKNWTENLDKNKTYIGFEFETNVKSSDIFEHIMDELIKAKVIDDEKIKLVPTRDASIKGDFPVEWVSCPMEPKEAIKVFNIIKKLLIDNDCQYGREQCWGALHIHFSRTKNNKKIIWKLLNKLNKMSDYELERTFGKQSTYCRTQINFLRDFAYNEIYKKLSDASFDSGKINVEVDIENKLANYVGGEHSINLNFQHKDTYELRTPDGSKDLSVYLEWLKQQGVDLDL